jgi:hypothetical protein
VKEKPQASIFKPQGNSKLQIPKFHVSSINGWSAAVGGEGAQPQRVERMGRPEVFLRLLRIYALRLVPVTLTQPRSATVAVLVLGIWNLSGAWMLVLGASST